MGLADFKARLLLFFARKLREWANSIDENAQSPQPASKTVERRGSEPVTEFDHDALGSEPSNQLFTRVRRGPPQHWIDLVRERAPELLSLTQEYSLEEDSLPEDPVHADQSDIDDEIEITRPRAVDVPPDKEDVVRKSGSESLPPTRGVDKRNARKLTRVKSSPPAKPLTLKPLSEPNPFLQPPIHGGAQRTEPAERPQLIEVFNQQEKTETYDRSGRGAINEDQLTTSELARQAKPQVSRPDKAPVIYRTTKTEGTKVAQAQVSGELDAARRPGGERRVFDSVGKAESGPRRYWQAIVSVTRKTLRRTERIEGQSPVTPINLAVNSPLKDSSSTAKIVRLGESSKRTQPPIKRETSSTPIRKRSEQKAVTVVYPRLEEEGNGVMGNRERELLSPPPRVSNKNVKTAPPQTAPTPFRRPVNRVVNASHAHIQDSFVQMPALMDEEKMNRASSVHLANLRPGKNQWPDLPTATSTEMADELAAHQRDLNRMRRLKQEQRGTPWNE